MLIFYSYVFWFGDLNFRLDDTKLKSAEEIVCTINNDESLKAGNEIIDLWTQDELQSVMLKSKAFKGFFEMLPTFPPTYRFVVGSDHYDLKYVFTRKIVYV